ncbi:MAG TPA: hypothetical protein VJ741_03840 [Solirubrobacteraceae bacterium]|nr:hypothetical protein [Solirubrobacteraceae bacterium]
MAMMREMKLAGTLVSVVVLGFAAPTALGRSSVLASGHSGQFVWQLTASDARAGDGRLGFCIDFGARIPPTRRNSGGSTCFFPGDVHRNGSNGAISFGSGVGAKSHAVQAWEALVDTRATTVVITLENGRNLRARTHPLPARFHARARLAWVVQSVPKKSLTTIRNDPVGMIAYDAAGRVVGTSP